MSWPFPNAPARPRALIVTCSRQNWEERIRAIYVLSACVCQPYSYREVTSRQDMPAGIQLVEAHPELWGIRRKFWIAGGPIHVACEQFEGKSSAAQEDRPRRKAVIIKKASKATQTRASRLRSSPQESDSRLKDVRETLEWYFR